MNDSTTRDIYLFADLRNERLLGFSLNVLAKARDLSRETGGEAVAVVFQPSGVGPEDVSASTSPIPIDLAWKRLVAHGADRVLLVETGDLVTPGCEVPARALAHLVGERKPMLVLFALTDLGRDMASMAARVSNAGLIADCVDLKAGEKGITGLCPAWGGEIAAEIGFAHNRSPGFATVHPTAFVPIQTAGRPGTLERTRVGDLKEIGGLRLLSRSPEPPERRLLEDAEVVVVGGAGLGSSEGFGMARDLAAALGGEVAATRPPVLQHWVEEERMIGQTGKTVSPELLLSIGTSGAIQYTAGIMKSKTIVAVNRDPNAPIFQVADLGVVADAAAFLPLLTTLARQKVMRRLADALTDVRGGSRGEEGFGARIEKLRKGQGWSREALAEATGQTPDFIARVESDRTSPPVSFLVRLAGALNIDPGTFLHKEEQAAIRDQRARSFIKRTRSYSYQTLTPGAENSHLRAFMVTIESHHAHKPVEYRHEGEEFIYVMDGDLEFTLGGKVHVLKKGESIHFNSDIPHKLKSLSSEPTRCLVMLYTL
ncbi:MAG: FAD-binding protein [Deltaproteobacteria bacterium]|nr:FAD-binding protein [Deltaproteobacteria bacterium]